MAHIAHASLAKVIRELKKTNKRWYIYASCINSTTWIIQQQPAGSLTPAAVVN